MLERQHIATSGASSLNNDNDNQGNESPRWKDSTTLPLERLPWVTVMIMKTARLHEQLELADDGVG